MSGSHDIWLGDLLRCLDRLGPLHDDRAEAVARLLGFTWAPVPGDVVEPDDVDDERADHAGEETFGDDGVSWGSVSAPVDGGNRPSVAGSTLLGTCRARTCAHGKR
jgi:hypothetical protein